ncbi:3-keto-disaccharide hydrolase [Coraliomargarita sp. W4R72]
MNLQRNLLTVACMLSSLLSTQAEELISHEVFKHFRPTQQWHLVNEITLSKADPSQFSSQTDQSGHILLNANKKTPKLPYLFTRESYGDLELNLEFMIPQGANAGVYLMGCYEIQIFDSYGVEHLEFSDMGGVYQRYQKERGQDPKGYEGVPPLVNATKAPGEWQSLDIRFRAPRFDANGSKIENARFIAVHLNGQLVQQDVEVTGPTRANPIKQESAMGPVAIQGNHGPVALRSFRVKSLEN